MLVNYLFLKGGDGVSSLPPEPPNQDGFRVNLLLNRVENGGWRCPSAACATRSFHKRAASAGARTSSTLQGWVGFTRGGWGVGCWFPEAPKPAASGPPPHPAPSHRWGDEDKPERGKHQVKPGELEKWRRNGEGKIQSPLDSTPRVLFGQPN